MENLEKNVESVDSNVEEGTIDSVAENSAKTYSYKTCCKVYKQHSTCSRHQKTCRKGKPFICNTCSSAFKRNDALKRHKYTCKPKPKSFDCEKCNKKFTENWRLLQHQKKVDCTKSKSLSCTYCARSFQEPVHLSKHINAKHQDKLRVNLLIKNCVDEQMATDDGSNEGEEFCDENIFTDGEENDEMFRSMIYLNETGKINKDNSTLSMINQDHPEGTADNRMSFTTPIGNGTSNYFTEHEADQSEMDQTVPEGMIFFSLYFH